MSHDWLIDVLLEKFRQVDAANVEAVGWYVDRLLELEEADSPATTVLVREADASPPPALREVVDALLLQEAQASVALDRDPRMQTHYAGDDCDPPHPGMDASEDTNDPDGPETESAAPDIPRDTAPRAGNHRARSKVPCVDDQRHSWPDGYDAEGWQLCTRGCGAGRKREGPKGTPSTVVPPERVGVRARPLTTRTGAAGSVPCIRPEVRHSWPIRPDLDGWARCVREGCGAARRNNEGRAFPASEVPPRRVPPAAEGSPPPPPFREAPAPAGVEAASQQPAEPAEPPAALVEANEPADDEEPPQRTSDELELDEDLEAAARGPVIDGHELARLARPESSRALVKLGPRCERCGEQLLTERDQDGDLEYVCINGHRRYGRSPAELAEMLAQETAAFAGKQRRREPSHGGAKL